MDGSSPVRPIDNWKFHGGGGGGREGRDGRKSGVAAKTSYIALHVGAADL